MPYKIILYRISLYKLNTSYLKLNFRVASIFKLCKITSADIIHQFKEEP